MLIARNSPILDRADTVRSNHVRLEPRFNSWYRLSVKLGMIWDIGTLCLLLLLVGAGSSAGNLIDRWSILLGMNICLALPA